MQFNIFLLIFTFFITACKKDAVTSPENPYEEEPCLIDCDTLPVGLKVIWQSPVGVTDTNFHTTNRIIFIDKSFINNKNFTGPNDILAARDILTGEFLWTWDDINELADGSSISDIDKISEKIIACAGKDIFVIDAQTGITDWKTDAGDTGGRGWPRISIIGDKIYHSHISEGTDYETAYLVQADINTPQWDTLFAIHKSEQEGYRPGIEPPVLWLDPTGDSILIFKSSEYNFSAIDSRGVLYAFNLEKKEVVWRINDIEGAQRTSPPVVYQNKIYCFGASQTIQCINAITGEVLWTKIFDSPLEGASFGNSLVLENKLIVKTDGNTIYALDLASGHEIWRTENAGATPTALQYYNGNVYYSSIGDSKIFGVNVQTGQVILEEQTPNKAAYPNAEFTWSGLRIDTNTGYLYTADGHFAMCIDLNN